MAGFIRRFGFFPGVETITQIEGAIIVDLPPPGSVNGVGVGTTCLIGEFPDVTYGVAVSSAGAVTTKARPTEIFTSTDLINKVGSFDETIGDFGGAGGNGFVALRNKKFSRLIVVPINTASPQGIRAWRSLPTNISATNPSPAVPMQAATLTAGREFRSGSNRVRLAARTSFSDAADVAHGADASVLAAGAATSQLFSHGQSVAIAALARVGTTVTATVAANPFAVGQIIYLGPGEANFPAGAKTVTVTSPTTFQYEEAGAVAASTAIQFFSLINFSDVAKEGDALVLGVISGAGALGADADTYRIVAVVNAVQLTVEKQNGSSFTWTTGTALPFRVHPGASCDTGLDHQISEAGGYLLPARPLDATIAENILLAPTIAPPAAAASTWDPLSGLTARTHPTAPGLVFDTNVQGINKANHASINALYASAIDSLLADDVPARDVNILYCARSSRSIANKMRQHVLGASSQGVGRVAVASPGVGSTASTGTQDVTVSTGEVAGTSTGADFGVGSADASGHDERVFYSWPGIQTFIPEAANIPIKTATGLTTTDGVLDIQADGSLCAVMSNLPPERNPGQAGAPVPELLSHVLGVQRGVSSLGIAEYTTMRQRGIAGIRIDRSVGPIFQSGITTSLISGQKNINRRRMADFIEDSLAQRYVQFAKLPLTNQLKDAILGETFAFCNGLLSPNNPTAQRIAEFAVDGKSGNTFDLEAKGIYVVIVRVRTLATADFIVLQAEIGEGVKITTT